MAQQTSLEWLIHNIPVRYQNTFLNDCADIIKKAKQIEKEQVINAHIEGQRVFDNYPHTQWSNDQAEQYYNKTYEMD